MSGGSKSSGTTDKSKGTPSGVADRPRTTIQPAMPGQLEAISQQLAAGYGQPPDAIMAMLNEVYRPMSVPAAPGTPGAGGSTGGTGGTGGTNNQGWLAAFPPFMQDHIVAHQAWRYHADISI
jgi:hypothetical protein